MIQLGDSTDHPEPVIEPSSGGATTVDIAARALHLRIRQQEILAELGAQALQGKPFFRPAQSNGTPYCRRNGGGVLQGVGVHPCGKSIFGPRGRGMA